FLQDPVDDPDEWIQLRPRRWPAPPVSRRHRERQHLRHRPRVDPEPTCRLPPTHPLHIHRSPHLPVQFHAFHPSALCPSWQKTFCCRTFAPALRPVYQAASLRDFFTGALTRISIEPIVEQAPDFEGVCATENRAQLTV